MIRDLIKLLDEDKDGQLSEEEFMGYYSHRYMEFDKVYSENNCSCCDVYLYMYLYACTGYLCGVLIFAFFTSKANFVKIYSYDSSGM